MLLQNCFSIWCWNIDLGPAVVVIDLSWVEGGDKNLVVDYDTKSAELGFDTMTYVLPVAFQPSVGTFFMLVIRLFCIEKRYLKKKRNEKKWIITDRVGGIHFYVVQNIIDQSSVWGREAIYLSPSSYNRNCHIFIWLCTYKKNLFYRLNFLIYFLFAHNTECRNKIQYKKC